MMGSENKNYFIIKRFFVVLPSSFSHLAALWLSGVGCPFILALAELLATQKSGLDSDDIEISGEAMDVLCQECRKLGFSLDDVNVIESTLNDCYQ